MHIPRTHRQEEERILAIHLHHEYGALQLHLIQPCPPTKLLCEIKQNCRIHPTVTPWSTSGYPGDVGFGRAMERWLRFMGCIFRAKFGLWEDCIFWPNCNVRAGLDRLSWLKKQPYHNQPLGYSSVNKLAMVRKGGYVWCDE